jgi:hypothetical protein
MTIRRRTVSSDILTNLSKNAIAYLRRYFQIQLIYGRINGLINTGWKEYRHGRKEIDRFKRVY